MKNFRNFFVAVLALSATVVWYGVFYFENHQDLVVTFFDVGQGDSQFLEFPNGTQILIDGGPGNAVLAKLGRVMPFWDRSIDLLILTHPHADHLDGLLEVLRRYDIGTVLESGTEHSLPEYQEWRALLKEKNIPVVYGHRGQKIRIGEGIDFSVLAPFEDFSQVPRKNPHDATVVSKLTYGNNSFLFTGDAEKPIEYELVNSNTDLRADVLKIGHHGSKTSSTQAFLDAVAPRIAVIQVGRKNRYGHPTQEVLGRLAAMGIRVFRNDLDGNVSLRSDGRAIRITN